MGLSTMLFFGLTNLPNEFEKKQKNIKHFFPNGVMKSLTSLKMKYAWGLWKIDDDHPFPPNQVCFCTFLPFFVVLVFVGNFTTFV